MGPDFINIALAVGVWIANILLAFIAKTMQKQATQINDMHIAHLGDKATDRDGRPKWWFPTDLRDVLVGINATQKVAIRVQEEMIEMAVDQREMQTRIETTLTRIEGLNAEGA